MGIVREGLLCLIEPMLDPYDLGDVARVAPFFEVLSYPILLPEFFCLYKIRDYFLEYFFLELFNFSLNYNLWMLSDYNVFW